MTKLCLPLFGLLYYTYSIAQSTETITVKTGTGISESVPAADLYQYSQFVNGMVYFRNGRVQVLN